MNIGIYHPFDDSTLMYGGENEWDLKMGDPIIFSHGDKKELFGRVSFFDRKKLTNETPLDGKILRKANEKDEEKLGKLENKALETLETCKSKVTELGLSMQILHATYAFDESEISFFYNSTERVDFRELVPKLAGALKTRIHLQQIGVRDRAKVAGGYGPCGREQCCTSGVLPEFKSITMEMARLQELAMKGADKLSGNCGKLLCCLSYEVDAYAKMRKSLPEYGRMVKTSKGAGKVIGLDILNQIIKIYLDVGGVVFLPAGDVEQIKGVASRKSFAKK